MNGFVDWIQSIFKGFQIDKILSVLNSEIVTAIIGASVTILGVWITVKHERKMRLQERKDEIKPAMSIKFIGLSDEIKKSDYDKLENIVTNTYSYDYSPILDTFSLYRKDIFSDYNPNIGRWNIDGRKSELLIDVHVDGNFPVTDITMTDIYVTNKADIDFINENVPVAIGKSFKRMNSMFDFYHKHIPSNFTRSDHSSIGLDIIDTRNLNKYISPNNNMTISIPMKIGRASLKECVDLIKNSENFNKEENYLEKNIDFNNPEILSLFLYNMSTISIPLTLKFEYKDIDMNTYCQNIPIFGYFAIDYIEEYDDYVINPSMTTKSSINSDIDYKKLKDCIYGEFDSIIFNVKRYINDLGSKCLSKKEREAFNSRVIAAKTKEDFESIYNELDKISANYDERILKEDIHNFISDVLNFKSENKISEVQGKRLLFKLERVKNKEDLKDIDLELTQMLESDDYSYVLKKERDTVKDDIEIKNVTKGNIIIENEKTLKVSKFIFSVLGVGLTLGISTLAFIKKAKKKR